MSNPEPYAFTPEDPNWPTSVQPDTACDAFNGLWALEFLEGAPASPMFELELEKIPIKPSPKAGSTLSARLPQRSPMALPAWDPSCQPLDCVIGMEERFEYLEDRSIGSGLASTRKKCVPALTHQSWAWSDWWPRVRDVIRVRYPDIHPPDWRRTWWLVDPNGEMKKLLMVTMPEGAIPHPGRSYHLVTPDGYRQFLSSPLSNPGPWGATEPECDSLFWCALAQGQYFLCPERAGGPQSQHKDRKPQKSKGGLRLWEDPRSVE